MFSSLHTLIFAALSVAVILDFCASLQTAPKLASLSGRVALVTGSSSGIGLGIATVLATHGCSVMLTGSRPANDDVINSASHNKKYPVQYCQANLADPAEIDRLFDETEKNFGSVDILVNNAGMQFVSPLEDFPEEKWNEVLNLDLTSCFRTTKRALSGMKSKGYGRIVNIASAHAFVASRNKAAYVSSKHGLIGLTKVTALEYAGTGVTCNAVCPGWVLTPLVEKQIEERSQISGRSIEEEGRLLLEEKQPSKQFVQSSDIGELVAFLASPYTSQLTGASIPVDGGWTIQ